MADYYLFLDGAVQGPHPAELIRSWTLPPGSQVCAAGTEEWILATEVPELLSPPNPSAAARSPLRAVAAGELTERKKIFIIHGRGNTMDHAFERLISLVRVKFRYFRANFYVDEYNSNLVRYILYDAQTNPYLQLFDRMITGKIVVSPSYPPSPDWSPDRTWTKLSEFKVADKCAAYGAPMTGAQKREWADDLFRKLWQDAERLFGVSIPNHPALAEALLSIRMSLRPPDGGLWLEKEYKDAIRALWSSRGLDPQPFIDALLELQRLNDAGGDLDTIASNALYGAWLQEAWTKKYGVPPRYGRDFEFDFVNYHQSFLHLARHANCEIYLPDFPMEAIPDMEESARALRDVGSVYVRVDDHHPLGQNLVDLLERLKQEELIGEWVMSGPIKGTAEQPPEERTCGADLVHRAMLRGTGMDSPGLEELRRLAHQQDLHFIENPDDREHPDYLAIDLSKLIGSKHSRIDMAQQLMFVRSHEDMRGIMESTGWRGIVDAYEKTLEEIVPRLDACVAHIEFMDPRDGEFKESLLEKIVRWITLGKVNLSARRLKKGGHPVHRIVLTLAPFQSRKEPRINVATAIQYLKRHFRFDYFFYAWGSNLLTTRRYNDKDKALDLSVLMSMIGGPGDGGHSSAATCKPPSNPAWPAEKFAKLNKDNFVMYCRYVSERISAGTGMKIMDVRMLTASDRDFH